jgi:K+-sensing histidine kinase KdpD
LRLGASRQQRADTIEGNVRMPAMDDDRANSQLMTAIGGIAPVVVAAVLVVVRDHVLNANLALVLMAVVVLIALAGGRAAGALAALTATLSFDFFLTRPYLTLRMTSQDDIETAGILLVVGVVVGQYAARARRSRAAMEAGRSEIRRIHRLAERVAQGAAADEVILAGQTEIADLLNLRACRFERPPYGPLPQLQRSGFVDRSGSAVTVVRVGKEGFELPAEGVELAVLSRGRPVGRYVLEPTPGVGASLEQRVVAVALADQVGAAVDA